MAEPADLHDVTSQDYDFVLLAPAYPSGTRNGGEFVRDRVRAYTAAGLNGLVVQYGSGNAAEPWLSSDGSTSVLRIHHNSVDALIDLLALRDYPVLAHSPIPELQHLLLDRVDGGRLGIWFHGYEVRDTRRLHCNETTREAVSLRAGRATLNRTRFQAAARVFNDTRATTVFVSEFQRRMSEHDVGAPALNSRVIPNFIDGELFRGRVRRPDESRRILLIRSFNARNYANDIALRAIQHLSRRNGFDDLTFTIRGFGVHWAAETGIVRDLPNVDLQNAYSSAAEMAALHYDHGIFLVPSRYDTQGVMLGEAMASGMVTITNRVAAIPEFTDRQSSVLVKPDDPIAFAHALWHVVEHPEKMPAWSNAAMLRVRRQCSRENTIDRELELIRGLG